MDKNKEELVSFLLRIGLAFAFVYAAISSLVSPQNWVGFIPNFIANIFPTSILLVLFSIYEFALGAWLLSNKKIFYASIVSSVTILLIVIFNLAVLDVVFRDVAILLMAVALAVLSYKEK